MPFITAATQPQGHVGRTYYQVTYKPDGSGWCCVVEDVRPGETEVPEAAWLALRKANLMACEADQRRLGGLAAQKDKAAFTAEAAAIKARIDREAESGVNLPVFSVAP